MTENLGKPTPGVPGAQQPPAQQPPAGRGTNWPAIILGGVLIVVVIALALLIIPRLGGEVADEAPATAPPEKVEVVIATREPRPTQEQAEIQPVEDEEPPAEAPSE